MIDHAKNIEAWRVELNRQLGAEDVARAQVQLAFAHLQSVQRVVRKASEGLAQAIADSERSQPDA